MAVFPFPPLEDYLLERRNISFLTGSGGSTAAGIEDFKAIDQNWKYSISREEIMSVDFIREFPEAFWEIYREIKPPENSEPTLFHQWVASLEEQHEITVVTQNTDGLHQKAGSANVIEAHGNSKFLICKEYGLSGCGAIYQDSAFKEDELPKCLLCGRILRPNIVLFGEQPKRLSGINESFMNADMLIVAGTSLSVSPWSEIPKRVQAVNPDGRRVWINVSPPPPVYYFTDVILTCTEALAFALLSAGRLTPAPLEPTL